MFFLWKCFSKAMLMKYVFTLSSVQSLSCVWHFETQGTAAYQASLSITNSWGLLKLVSIEVVMPSNHHILCHILILLSSIFPSIRVFFFFNFIFKLYIIVLVLPYTDMNHPWIYMCTPSWTTQHLPTYPIPQGHPTAPAPSTLSHASIWTGHLFRIW